MRRSEDAAEPMEERRREGENRRRRGKVRRGGERRREEGRGRFSLPQLEGIHTDTQRTCLGHADQPRVPRLQLTTFSQRATLELSFICVLMWKHGYGTPLHHSRQSQCDTNNATNNPSTFPDSQGHCTEERKQD